MAPALHSLIARLWCLHWPRARAPAGTAATLQAAGVVLDTCLRQLAFGLAPRPGVDAGPAGELSTGADAYRLLLEVVSGLRSEVPGETNVSGQFRRAWEQAALRLRAEDRWQLQTVVQALRADTRALRASHLQGVAGGSYGSLVRELLAPGRGARVLFVGTGELARSMLPLFRSWEVGAWNHRTLDEPSRQALSGVHRWFASDEADAAAAWPTAVVFTTPADVPHDAAWRERLGSQAPHRIVHLGQRRDTRPAWPAKTGFFDLDDVFDLARAREQQRRRQLAAAGLACAALVDARMAGPEERGIPTPDRSVRPRRATA